MAYRNFNGICLYFLTLLFANVRLYGHEFYRVPMWGSEVANPKADINITNKTSEVMWLCNVTTIEHEGDKCRSSVFRKERLMYPRLITLLR